MTEPGSNIGSEKKASLWAADRRQVLGGALAGAVVWSFPGSALANGQVSGNISGGCSVNSFSQSCGGQGLTIGFWKNHCNAWPCELSPYSTQYDDVFGVQVFGWTPLFEVICGNGTSGFICQSYDQYASWSRGLQNAIYNLGRQSVAALLNSWTPVKYKYSVSQIKEMVQSAFSSYDQSTINSLASEFEFQNSLENVTDAELRAWKLI